MQHAAKMQIRIQRQMEPQMQMQMRMRIKLDPSRCGGNSNTAQQWESANKPDWQTDRQSEQQLRRNLVNGNGYI